MSVPRQRGAALLVVLLLVATLSFIALSITDRMLIASSRSVNARVRSELLWRVFAAEALARKAIETAAQTDGFRFAADNPFFLEAQNVPMDDGGALLSFRDGSLCFNLNSLSAATEGTGQKKKDEGEAAAANDPAEELDRIIDAAGLDDVKAERVVAVVRDWIDTDSFQSASGAEDDYYAGLPAPYRTGGAQLADVSELRAMSAIDAKAYQQLRPFICALPATTASAINVNMLKPADAPLLAAMVGAQMTTSAAQEVIRNRPPGGYKSVEDFWRVDAFAGKEISETTRGRARIKSDYIGVDAAVRFHDRTATLTMLFQIDGQSKARLIERQIGAAP